MSGFGVLAVVVQAGLIGPAVAAFGERRVLFIGLTSAALGIGLAALSQTPIMFALTLLPVAVGMGLCNPTLSSLVSQSADASDQGKVQGTAGALESLGRTIGPVVGNGLLQQSGEGASYGWASGLLIVTLVVAMAGKGGSRVRDMIAGDLPARRLVLTAATLRRLPFSAGVLSVAVLLAAAVLVPAPRLYSLKKLIVTGWSFIVLVAAWLIDQTTQE